MSLPLPWSLRQPRGSEAGRYVDITVMSRNVERGEATLERDRENKAQGSKYRTLTLTQVTWPDLILYIWKDDTRPGVVQ